MGEALGSWAAMSTSRPPAAVLLFAAARGADPGAALGRRVARALERTEQALKALAEDERLLTREGGRLGHEVIAIRETLFRARARLDESVGRGPLPAPRRAETVAAIHEQVRESLAEVDRTLKRLPPEVLPPEGPALVRPLSPR